MKATAKWESEAAMLTAFTEIARGMGFRVVPEACGHDLILVAGAELKPPGRYQHFPDAVEPGDVIAVEGKLRGSVEVLRQALPPHRRTWTNAADVAAADFYAVVIPDYDSDFLDVATGIDVSVWTMCPASGSEEHWTRRPAELKRFEVRHGSRVVGHPRLDVPTLDVEMPAGVPAPRKLTPWKIAAVRLCLLGAQRDLTAADFVGTPVSVRSLEDRRWITRVSGRGKSAVFRLADHPGRPDRVYPEIVAAIAVEDPVTTPLPKGALWGAA